MALEFLQTGGWFYFILLLAVLSLFCIGMGIGYLLFRHKKEDKVMFVNLRDKLKEISGNLENSDKIIKEIDNVLKEVAKNATR